jgi:hypothetical protein
MTAAWAIPARAIPAAHIRVANSFCMGFLLVEKPMLSNWHATSSIHGKSNTYARNNDTVSA